MDLIREGAQTVTGRIIAGRCIENVLNKNAYMDITVRVPKGLGGITMGARLLVTKPEMIPVNDCPHEGRTMDGGCLDCGDPSF